MNGNSTILLVSGDVEQFAIVTGLIRSSGLNATFARTVRECLTLAGAELPALIISELAVPDIDGLQLCLRIRAVERSRTTPILLVGDLPRSSPIVADGRRCGANSYLQKPIPPLRLFDKCVDLLNVRNRDSQIEFARYSSTLY